MARMRYTDLLVWQRGMDLVTDAYAIAGMLPDSERFGLAAQLRRAATAVPANIAEGHGRLHRREYIHHLSIANGSLREVETHVQIAARLGQIQAADADVVLARCDTLGRMLSGLIRRLRALPSPHSPLPSDARPAS